MQGVHELYGHVWRTFRFLKRKSPTGLFPVGLPVAFLLAALAVAAALAASAPFGPWQAPLLRDHPLVGKILDTTNAAELPKDELLARLQQHDIVLLGETHDNPDHHRIQAQLLRALARATRKRHGKPPAVVFEMIPYTFQQRLDLILKLPEVDADMVFDAVRWEELGWPDRKLYRPIIEAALQVRAPLIAAGVPQKLVRKVSREGLSVLPRQELRTLRLAPLPPEQQEAMVREIMKSHCDMIPPEVARRMSTAQRLRDARLALGLRTGFMRQGSAVLITGTGHVRKDRAVPVYLRRHGITPPPLVVWQAEAQKEAKTLRQLLPNDARPDELADVVIVTPRATRDDQCERFERFLKRKRQRQGQPPKTQRR